MVTLRAWIDDWKKVTEGVKDGVYEPINASVGEDTFEILRVSKFDQEIDGPRKTVETPARIFDDKVALFTHRTRDSGIVRIITKKGRKCFVLEQGTEVIEWAAAVEGVSTAELRGTAGESALWRSIALQVRLQKARRAVLVAQVEQLKQRTMETEQEVQNLQLRLRIAMEQLGQMARRSQR